MKEWSKISLLLSLFGFFRETKPSAPFITDFLIDFKNVTLDQVLRDIYPIGTYSYMALAIVALLVTDLLRYRPLIFVSGLTGIITWLLFIRARVILTLQFAEIFYGAYLATEVSYYTYIYAKVQRKYYNQVTAHTRAAVFLGRFIGSTSGQLLVYAGLMNYFQLNYLTLGTQIICTFLVLTLPHVKTSVYFHRESVVDASFNATQKRGALELMWSQFKNSFTDIEIVQWSLWYALGNCGFAQVTTYIQVLWGTIETDQQVVWNGAVEALITLLSVAVTLCAEKLKSLLLMNKSNLVILTTFTALEGVSLIITSKTDNLMISYLGYVLFCTFYALTITICSAGLANKLEDDSFGLVFGVNTFVALIMQSLLTTVCVSGGILTISVTQQFYFYSGFYFLFAILYLFNIIIDLIRTRKD